MSGNRLRILGQEPESQGLIFLFFAATSSALGFWTLALLICEAELKTCRGAVRM